MLLQNILRVGFKILKTVKSKMLKLILVRHGQTDWVTEKRYQGNSDIGLNQKGLAEALKIGRSLRFETPLAIYTSGLRRAHQSATPLSLMCRKPVIIDKRLNEISFGRWEGSIHTEIEKRFPRSVRRFYLARLDSQPDGGESLKSLGKRISSFLKDVMKKYGKSDGTVVVISHGCPTRMILIKLLGLPLSIFWSIRVDAGSFSILRVRADKRIEISLLNGKAHLDFKNGHQTKE